MHQPIPLVARIDNSQSVFYHFSGPLTHVLLECNVLTLDTFNMKFLHQAFILSTQTVPSDNHMITRSTFIPS